MRVPLSRLPPAPPRIMGPRRWGRSGTGGRSVRGRGGGGGGERWPLFKQLAGARPPVARRGARGKDVGGEWGEGLEMAPLHTKGLGCSGSKAEGWILRWPGRTGPREGLTLTMAPVAMARVNPSSTASFLLAASHLRSLYQRLLRRTKT